MCQVDHILVAPGMVVGGVRTILIPQQAPGTFIQRQGCIQGEGSIVRLGGADVILQVEQVRAAIEPGEELFPPAQAARFRQCQFGGGLEILLWVAVRAEDRLDFRGAFGGKDDHIDEVEVPPELRNHFVGHSIRLGRTFIRVVDQELPFGIIVAADDLVMTQPGIIVRIQPLFDQHREASRHQALEQPQVAADPPQGVEFGLLLDEVNDLERVDVFIIDLISLGAGMARVSNWSPCQPQ